MWKGTECKNNVPGRGNSKCKVSQANGTPVEVKMRMKPRRKELDEGVGGESVGIQLEFGKGQNLQSRKDHSILDFILCVIKNESEGFFFSPHRKST